MLLFSFFFKWRTLIFFSLYSIESGKLILENCRFEENSTGISARMGSEVFLKGCSFVQCSVGVDVSDSCEVTLQDVTFEHEEGHFGMILETEKVPEGETKKAYKGFNDLPR